MEDFGTDALAEKPDNHVGKQVSSTTPVVDTKKETKEDKKSNDDGMKTSTTIQSNLKC